MKDPSPVFGEGSSTNYWWRIIFRAETLVKDLPPLWNIGEGYPSPKRYAPTPMGYRVQCFGDVALSCGQGVDITIPVTCSVFEPDPMTSQCTRGVPWLKFEHKIHEMWIFFSFVAIASQKFYRRVAKHHCCFISHGATPGADDVTGQGDLAGWPYLYYRALSCGNLATSILEKVSWHFFVLRNFDSTFSARNRQNKPSELNPVLLYVN